MTSRFVVINEKIPHWCLGKNICKSEEFKLAKNNVHISIDYRLYIEIKKVIMNKKHDIFSIKMNVYIKHLKKGSLT
ncbi:MAG: hypothetical protein HQ569_08445 [Actinobacteria bacterium]|nr:hypothetical protein [Actinomycetota bacterium]